MGLASFGVGIPLVFPTLSVVTIRVYPTLNPLAHANSPLAHANSPLAHALMSYDGCETSSATDSATGMLHRVERIDLSGSSIHVANVRLGGCKGLVAGGVGEQVAWATP